MLKYHTYQSLKEVMLEDMARAVQSENTKFAGETYCIIHDYSYELFLSLLDDYWKNEFWDIYKTSIKNKPVEHLVEAALVRIDATLKIAAAEGASFNYDKYRE